MTTAAVILPMFATESQLAMQLGVGHEVDDEEQALMPQLHRQYARDYMDGAGFPSPFHQSGKQHMARRKKARNRGFCSL